MTHDACAWPMARAQMLRVTLAVSTFFETSRQRWSRVFEPAQGSLREEATSKFTTQTFVSYKTIQARMRVLPHYGSVNLFLEI